MHFGILNSEECGGATDGSESLGEVQERGWKAINNTMNQDQLMLILMLKLIVILIGIRIGIGIVILILILILIARQPRP